MTDQRPEFVFDPAEFRQRVDNAIAYYNARRMHLDYTKRLIEQSRKAADDAWRLLKRVSGRTS